MACETTENLWPTKLIGFRKFWKPTCLLEQHASSFLWDFLPSISWYNKELTILVFIDCFATISWHNFQQESDHTCLYIDGYKTSKQWQDTNLFLIVFITTLSNTWSLMTFLKTLHLSIYNLHNQDWDYFCRKELFQHFACQWGDNSQNGGQKYCMYLQSAIDITLIRVKIL